MTTGHPLTSMFAGHSAEAAEGIEPSYRALQAPNYGTLTRTFAVVSGGRDRIVTTQPGTGNPNPVPRMLVTAVAAILAVVVLAGCILPGSIPTGWTWVGPTHGTHVAVVGDSLTWQAEHGSSSTSDPYYLRHRLIDQLNGEGWSARVAALSGETTAVLRKWVYWQSAPDVIVMALGTNDQYFDVPLATSIANVRGYLARWPNARVVYVGVVPSLPRGIADTAPAWNDWLRGEAAATGGIYLDWPVISAGHPDWFVADQLHHTAAGQAAYRAAIVAAVQETAP